MNFKKRLQVFSPLLIMVFCILIFCVLYLILIKSLSIETTKIGAIGDSFGILNTFFSGVAFVGLIYAIMLQYEQLGAQKTELLNNREELKMQREELESHRKEFQINRITNIIYHQISICKDSLEKLQINNGNKIIHGKTAINWILKKISNLPYNYQRKKVKINNITHQNIIDNKKWINDNYSEILKFTDVVFNSCLVIQLVLSNDDINNKDLNELKIIFFANLGLDLDIFFMKLELIVSKTSIKNDENYFYNQLKKINQYQKFSYKNRL